MTIRDFTFEAGDLVLVRNTEVEFSLDKKMKPRYLGPMIVIAKTRGGAYVIAELDGSVFHEKVAKFRVIPYFARRRIDLPSNMEELIEISTTNLEKIEGLKEIEAEVKNKDFIFESVRLTEESDESDEEETDLEEESISGNPEI
jgi:hypothetical protein